MDEEQSWDFQIPKQESEAVEIDDILDSMARLNFNEDGWKEADLTNLPVGGASSTSYMALELHDFRNLHYGDLDPDQQEKLVQLLYKHRDCFAASLTDVGRTSLLEHHIRVPKGTNPVYRPGLKRFSQPKLAFIKEQVEKQLQAGIIRENDGPWCAPVTLG